MFVMVLATSLHAGVTSPELDPVGVMGAFGLIGGVVLVVRANKKK